MPAFCHQVHLWWVRVRLARSIRVPALRTLPTLTKAATGLLPGAPAVRSERYIRRRVGHPANAAYCEVAESIRAATSTGLPEASVTVAWRTTVASALPRRTSA
jgi:hypothetical protein